MMGPNNRNIEVLTCDKQVVHNRIRFVSEVNRSLEINHVSPRLRGTVYLLVLNFRNLFIFIIAF